MLHGGVGGGEASDSVVDTDPELLRLVEPGST
jgi:hypothetical protein